MATLEPEVIAALNALLEDERASVEMAVALASGATEYLEREALSAMGGEDTAACCALRERMERLEAPVTRRINGIVFSVVGLDRYDERLRAFARHQGTVTGRIEALLATTLDREIRRILEEARDAHARHVGWCMGRADEFTATRDLDLSSAAGRAAVRRGAGATDAPPHHADGAPPPTPAGVASGADATMPPEEMAFYGPPTEPKRRPGPPRADLPDMGDDMGDDDDSTGEDTA